MPDAAQTSHAIASKHARQLVIECLAAGLDWKDIALSVESAVAIVVCAAIEMTQPREPVRFATEIVDTITERAHQRVVLFLHGAPPDA